MQRLGWWRVSFVQEMHAITQAAVIHGVAVADHPLLGHAQKISGIKLSKEQATIKFIVVKQSVRMIGQNRSTAKNRGNNTAEGRKAAEVMLTFSAPSPKKER